MYRIIIYRNGILYVYMNAEIMWNYDGCFFFPFFLFFRLPLGYEGNRYFMAIGYNQPESDTIVIRQHALYDVMPYRIRNIFRFSIDSTA